MNKHAERCKKIIKDSGLNKAALAKILGVSSQAMTYWEQGKFKPNGPAQLILMIASTSKGLKAIKEAAIKLSKEV